MTALRSPLDVFAAVTAVELWLKGEAAKSWAKLRPKKLQETFVAQIVVLQPKVIAAQSLAAQFGATGTRLQAATLLSGHPAPIVQQVPQRAADPSPRAVAEVRSEVRNPPSGPQTVVRTNVAAVDSAFHVNPTAFAGVASDGRDLMGLLVQPIIETYVDLGSGMDTDRAMGRGMDSLDRILATQIHDAAREAGQAQAVAITEISGYVRLTEPSACDRCMVLDHKFFKVNKGFLRHPSCRCYHVWVEKSSDAAAPKAAPSGMSTVANTRGRTMPADIYQTAGNDRGLAIDLLQRNGFISAPRVSAAA